MLLTFGGSFTIVIMPHLAYPINSGRGSHGPQYTEGATDQPFHTPQSENGEKYFKAR